MQTKIFSRFPLLFPSLLKITPIYGETFVGLGEAGKGSKRTLTNLYNARPMWLELALNLERAGSTDRSIR
jgi:hypothetical protein